MLTVNILIVLVLIVLNGVFALSEMAVVSSRRARLQQRMEAGNRAATVAQELVDDPSRFLSTVQVGITLVGVVTGAFGAATIAEALGEWLDATVPALEGSGQTVALVVVVALTTYLTLIFGELVPKRIALRNPERMAMLIARPMSLLSRIAVPAVWLLGASTEGVLKLLGLREKDEQSVTEEEVRSMISEGARSGVFDPREQSMIDGVLRLDDRTASSVMVPRPNVLWLDIDDDLQAIHGKIESYGYSRFLVCRGEIDEMIGVVRTRDILDMIMREEPFELARCVVEPVVALESVPVLKLLDQFKTTSMHLAVVVDEYGSVEGIVTITDVIEVIAGDLPEHWEETRAQAVEREDGSWLVDGIMEIGDFERVLGLSGISHGKDYHTVAGFLLHRLEHLPKAGSSTSWNGIRLEILNTDGYRIDKVLVTPSVDGHPDSKTSTDSDVWGQCPPLARRRAMSQHTATEVDIQQLFDTKVYDCSGQRFATVNNVWVDENEHPLFLGILTRDHKNHIIPVQGGEVSSRGKKVRLAYDQDTVNASPTCDPDKDLRQEDVRRVYDFFQGKGPDVGASYTSTEGSTHETEKIVC